MNNNILKTFVRSIVIAIIGVFVIDYFSHLLFSNPMETTEYFYAKCLAYFIYSMIVLSTVNYKKSELLRVVISGVVIASLWGIYYNVLPEILDYYPQGIALAGLSFLGVGILGTGIAFGTVHTVAFVGGYYCSKVTDRLFK